MTNIYEEVAQRENEDRDTIFQQIIESVGQQSDCSTVFNLIKSKLWLSDKSDSKGRNILHIVVLEKATHLLDVLFYTGLYEKLLDKPVENKRSPLHGYSAEQIAKKYRFKEATKKLADLKNKEFSLTEVQKLVRKGDWENAKDTLTRYSDTDLEREVKDIAFFACVSGHLDILKMLYDILKIRNLSKDFINSKELMDKSIYLGHMDIIIYFIEDQHIDSNEKCNGKSFVELAIDYGNIKSLEILVATGGELTYLMLHTATIKGDVKMWDYIFKKSESSHVHEQDTKGRTLMHVACEHSKKDILKRLLEIDVSNNMISVCDKQHRTILFSAITSGNIEILKMVLDEMKRRNILLDLINQKDYYFAFEQVKLVIGRDINGSLGHHFVKVHRFYLKRLEKLLTHGGSCEVADLGILIPDGSFHPGPPSDEEKRSVLQNYDITHIDSLEAKEDMTPLIYSLVCQQPDMSRLLMLNRCNITLTDYFGLAPVHFAAMRGYNDILTMLKEKGADLKQNCDYPLEGLNNPPWPIDPIDVAKENGEMATVQFLKNELGL